MNEKDYGVLNTEEEADRQIFQKILKIKGSIDETDALKNMMRSYWSSEEGEVFFSAYDEFKEEILDFTDKYKSKISDLERIEREIMAAQNNVLADNIIL